MRDPRVLLAGSLFLAAPAGAQTVHFTAFGDAPGDFFGASVDRAGDVDGDGVGDLVVGGSQHHPDFVGPGLVKIVSGATGLELWRANGDSPCNTGSTFCDQMGRSVAGLLADIDGDTVPDVLAGAPRDDDGANNAGRVRALSGATGATIWDIDGLAARDLLGTSLARIGDVTGDGVPDFVAGAPQQGVGTGYARVCNGATGATVYTVFGDGTNDHFGLAVAGVDDADGDLVPDFVVGAPKDDDTGTNAGSARLFSGATGAVLRTFFGAHPTSEFGHAVAGAGDIDGDGRGDVIVGAWRDDLGGGPFPSGSVWVYSGSDGSLIHYFTGNPENDDNGGRTVAGGGDVNGDGVPDVIFGARHDYDGEHTGIAFVMSGADGSTHMLLYGDEEPNNAEQAVAFAGDLDGDGFDELVSTFPQDDHHTPGLGFVRVWGGCSGSIVTYAETGCEGSGGIRPRLRIGGCPAPGKQVTFAIEEGYGGGTATVRFGRQEDEVDLGNGCTFYLGNPLPFTMAVPLSGAGPGMGFGSRTRPIPNSVASGTFIYVQARIPDPGNASGESWTPPVRIGFP